MKHSTRAVKSIAALTAMLVCGAAPAAVTCDQLGQMALSTERLRDQGFELAPIMLEIDKLVVGNNFTPVEVAAIRRAVEDAFLRNRTPNEIVVSCMASSKK